MNTPQAELVEIPSPTDVERVQTITVKPGDTLVVTAPTDSIPATVLAKWAAHVKENFGIDIHVMLMLDGMKIVNVIRKEP